MAEKGESSEAARKKKRLSLSLKRRKEENSASPLKKRFAKTSDQEMQSLKVKPMSKNTERSQRWALNVFKEWVRSNDWPEVEVERLWNEAGTLVLEGFDPMKGQQMLREWKFPRFCHQTASSQCEETDTSTSKLATLQSIEKLPLPSGEDKENKMFNFQNLTGCTINFNIH